MTKRTPGIRRRHALKLMLGATGLIAAPAIIGRATASSAQNAFAGEQLIVVSWSGNYEQVFREMVIDPFNAKYGTRAETVGGWDQIVSQIKAAPEDNPPYDLTIAEEYISAVGLAEKLFLKTDRSKIPNLDAVYPWFYETRAERARDYGIPFGGGIYMLLLRASLGLEPTSWELMWDERLAGKVTLDSAAWWWTLAVPALMDKTLPGLDEMYQMKTAEPLFAKLDTLKVAKWYRDGAEQANLLNQEEADAALCPTSDFYSYQMSSPGEYIAGVPKEGGAAWADWFFKVRGTRHSDLADLFMNYLLEKETQDRFLTKSAVFTSRRDVTVPEHWKGYPASNEELHEKYRIITLDGWEKIMADYQTFDDRMKLTVERSTAR